MSQTEKVTHKLQKNIQEDDLRLGWYLILLLGLCDCHHLDEVADGVLAVDRGAAPPLEPPLHRAAVYHWKGRRKLREGI